jgi:deoxyribodipyrimidine photo-lyase
MSTPFVIWWVKRDCRIDDNPALAAAIRTGRPVLPLFCFEPHILASSDYSPLHLHAQTEAVEGLRSQLRSRGGDIYVSYDEVLPTLERIIGVRAIEAIYAHEEIGNGLTFARDKKVTAWCRERGVRYVELPQSSVRRGGIDRDTMHAMWRERIIDSPVITPPTTIPMTAAMRCSAEATVVRGARGSIEWQPVSEEAGHATLSDFLYDRGIRYRGGISSPNTAFGAGSRLSVHLAWGTLSLRRVYQATTKRITELRSSSAPDSGRWCQSLGAFLSRLHWRDHFTQRLESEPEMEFQSLHPGFRELTYENDPHLFELWRLGRTGFPLVDAVMRCLSGCGFVNFRMRAMVVSFACHALHLDWRLIHPHLAGVFRDYEPGIHLSQLQMQAGVVGLNTVRVYSPIKQQLDHDSACRFIKRWIPELEEFPPEAIASGRALGDYPAPVIDWAERSKAMRGELYRIKRSEEQKTATDAVFKKHGSRKRRLGRARSRSTPGASGAQIPLLFEGEP